MQVYIQESTVPAVTLYHFLCHILLDMLEASWLSCVYKYRGQIKRKTMYTAGYACASFRSLIIRAQFFSETLPSTVQKFYWEVFTHIYHTFQIYAIVFIKLLKPLEEIFKVISLFCLNRCTPVSIYDFECSLIRHWPMEKMAHGDIDRAVS